MERSGGPISGAKQESFRELSDEILAPTTKRLVAISAAVALNCQPCINRLVPAALRNGVLPEEIAEAADLARQIRRHAGGLSDRLLTDLLTGQGRAEVSRDDCC